MQKNNNKLQLCGICYHVDTGSNVCRKSLVENNWTSYITYIVLIPCMDFIHDYPL